MYHRGRYNQLPRGLHGFTGGPAKDFYTVGHAALLRLDQLGLRAKHKLLDFGAGCLRIGRLLIPLLDAGNYYAIERNRAMLEKGIRLFSLPEKRPSFSSEGGIDFGVFGASFDFILIRSVWTHFDRAMIVRSIKQAERRLTPGGVLLASAILDEAAPCTGSGYQNRCIAHSQRWIERATSLPVEVLPAAPINRQQWLVLQQRGRARLSRGKAGVDVAVQTTMPPRS